MLHTLPYAPFPARLAFFFLPLSALLSPRTKCCMHRRNLHMHHAHAAFMPTLFHVI